MSLAATPSGVRERPPPGRRWPTPQAQDRLFKPFQCPGAAGRTGPAASRPARKRRRVDYAGADDSAADGDADKPYTNADRLALANRDANRFPIFAAKDKAVVFGTRFAVPLANKAVPGYERARPPPALGLRQAATVIARPLHDPNDEFAIVLYDPTVDDITTTTASDSSSKPALDAAQQSDKAKPDKLDAPLVHKSLTEILGIRKRVEGERPRVPVVIDPRLVKVLRPHQIEGVRFMYQAVTGLIDPSAAGCIMADEMGLGKTLQCVALLWTLLRQSPLAGLPTISKAIVVCPSSLVKNWANELVKWLGQDAIRPFAVDGKASKDEMTRQLRQWAIATGRTIIRPLLIISYETLRLNVGELRGSPIGMLICDEGHRLKNGDSQTFSALDGLNVSRRVILSGTPIQNDLSEYFSLVSFSNPGVLGARPEFRRRFELPILRGRDADASEMDRRRGDECLAGLLAVVNRFIIRRTNDILTKYLPVKYEHVVFCSLSAFQLALYNHFVTSPDVQALLRGRGSQPLKAIGLLRKLCNHPELLNLAVDLPGCESLLPEDFHQPAASTGYSSRAARGGGSRGDVRPWYSGKMVVLDRMLARIHAAGDEKIVLISNFTQTLDLFERLCRARGYGSLRLDGTMSVPKRQKLVDRFNDPTGKEFVFLLSSKAGGCGINLIGASRLVLFDPDWNPAADQQALARVWRDGQKKECFVYRFIATGTIEEKIFQRQSHKQSLSTCVVDSAEDVERHFSLESLRELFRFHAATASDTHDTFKCRRCRPGPDPPAGQFVKAPAMLYGDTSTWNHCVNAGLAALPDALLRAEANERDVSAVFQYKSH